MEEVSGRHEGTARITGEEMSHPHPVARRMYDLIDPIGLRDQFRMSFRRQMMEQARLRMASWTSVRRSVRMRKRRKLLSQANVRATGQRILPSPEPCSAPRRAMTGMTPRSRAKRRYLSWS